jgi:hypothetical protein
VREKRDLICRRKRQFLIMDPEHENIRVVARHQGHTRSSTDHAATVSSGISSS